MPNYTHPPALNDRGDRVAALQASLDQLGYIIPEHELEAQVFGVGTEDALLSFQTKSSLRRTGILDEDTEAALARAVAIVETGQNQVEGRIFSERGVPAEGVSVRLYSRGFGGAEERLGEVQTDDQGFYALPYDPAGRAANLEVRVVGLDGEEVSLSTTRFKADRYEMLNLVAPASVLPLAAEYDRLAADLDQHLGEQGNLGDAEENEDRQDLTLLHRATGWDARLIALVATADKFSADTGIARDALYALFRAGLPTDKQLLARVGVTAVKKALNKAAGAGIVSLDDQQTADMEAAFETFARETRRIEKAPGALSTFGDLLDKSGLNEEEIGLFEDLYFAHQDDAADLWEKARERGISQASIDGLRLQGKLAYLTFNNADLAASLQHEVGSPDDLAQVVDLDLYQASAWKERLGAMAGGDNDEALRNLIPAAYEGDTVADRLDAYAADLARKIRLSFPTQVVGRMIEKGDLSLGNGHDAANVCTFLKNAVKLDFELGRTPVGPFLEQPEVDVLPGMTPAEVEDTAQGIKLLHRLYQITPSDESLKAISKPELGFTSADDVVAFTYDEFCERFGASFPSLEEARLVYRKAQQVTTVTYNFCTMAKQMGSTPAMHVTSPPATQLEQARNNLIKHYPTLESLFGSLDFCECKHCRSVLSPAAYLVDLLQFLDPKKLVWDSFIKNWKKKHNKVPYPFKDQAAYKKFLDAWNKNHKNKAPVDKTPYEILINRRPDLPHIQLTCENTHTALPYIDVVNEILEYYVANGKLEAKAAHDTGKATTAELLAEPQYILSKAYDELKKARYPLKLPFDLWLETARRFFDHFETPLWRVLDLLCPTNKLFDTTKAYDRAAVFVESLGISPAEYDLFAESDPLDWHELYGYTDKEKAKALKDLQCAKILARRLDVSYKELVDIVQTSFVNPGLDDLALVWKLGLEVGDAVRYFNNRGKPKYAAEEQAFEDRMKALEKTHKLPADKTKTELESLWKSDKFRETLLLKDTSGLCDFDKTYLQFADGDPADTLVFLKINLFVRLWKKLGWSMEETDRALQLFLPKSSLPLDGKNLGTALETALLYLAHLKALDGKVKAGKDSRAKLLTLWSNLPTTGKESLYAQLFLTPSVLKDDPVFDDPLGNYLSKSDHLLTDHLRTLQGALNLTTDEIRRILLDVGKDIASLFSLKWSDCQSDLERGTLSGSLQKEFKANGISLSNSATIKTEEKGAKWRITDGQNQYIIEKAGETLNTYDAATAVTLTLDNVSLLFRYGLLAKALKLSVRDLIALKGLSGLDPFKPLSNAPLKGLKDDYPLTQTLRFVEMAEKVKDSGFAVEDLKYLLRHRFDPVGQYRTSAAAPLTLIKALAAGLRRIYAEHAVPADPASLTDDKLQQKLALVMASDVVQKFFGMWTGTVEYEARVENVDPANKLDPKTFANVSAIRVSYDAKTKIQRLTYRGVLTDTEKTVLKKTFSSKVLADLLDKVQKRAKAKAKEFFDKYLSGFLAAADFDLLFGAGLTDAKKRAKLAQAFLPYLQRRLSRQLIVQALASSLKADAALTEALLSDPGQPAGYLDPGTASQLKRLLNDPSQPGKPLLDAFVAAREEGVTATFFDSTGASIKTATLADVDTGVKNALGKPVKPAGTSSARFGGWFEVPTGGTYRFSLALKPGAEAEICFDHLPDPLLRGKTDSSSTKITEIAGSVELKAGVPYRFTLDARNLGSSDVAVLVQSADLPKDALSQLTLYPQAAVERLHRAWILLAKTLQLLQGLGLSQREVRHFVTYKADFNNLDLSKLPTRAADDSSTGATALLNQFIRLADYAILKRDLSEGSDDLISILENARRSYPASAVAQDKEKALLKDLCKRVAELTRRNLKTVQATVEHLGFTAKSTSDSNALRVKAPDFVQEKGLRKLWKVLQAMEKFGVSVETLAGWTGIVSNTMPDKQYAAIASELKSTIKSRYKPENWQRIAQSIFDKLRRRQRDVLVAHVMHEEGFERMEELFEYFLIDPGMEPIVQTSRIQLAISSVQLFIQRSLLNLEPLVDPSVINTQHWQWMKRYRVWEANRKIFLFPENWLEPEFRDDKTHLFQELESALLQGDVSNDLAEDAFLKYLKSLEELARLEIVTMYCEEKPLDPASNTLHVIGRTYNQPHKYFYRRYAHQMWTPWEPVTAEIEGDHVVAAFWRDRLHLFWVTFLDKAEKKSNPPSIKDKEKTLDKTTPSQLVKDASAASQRSVEVQLNWTEYFQGEWTTREASGFNKPLRVKVGEIDKDFDKGKIFIHVSENDEEQSITINLTEKNFNNWIPAQNSADATSIAPPKVNATAFHVVTKNSPPEIWPTARLQKPPYSTIEVEATQHKGRGPLQVTFKEKTVTKNGKQRKTPPTQKYIFREGLQQWLQRKRWDEFSLLTCSNSLRSFPDEIGALVSPFFYLDNQHTFFVEPTLTETTIVDWKEYVISPALPNPKLVEDDWWKEIPIDPKVSILKQPLPGSVGPLARFKIQSRKDWITDPTTVLEYKGQLIGKDGGLDSMALSAETAIDEFGMPVKLTVGNELNVIGSGGLNAVELTNLNTQTR